MLNNNKNKAVSCSPVLNLPINFLVVALAFSPVINAAESRSAEGVESSERTENIPEILVTDELNLPTLRTQVFEAERNVYKLFSELNDDDYYDIECHREISTGTQISEINCRPNYIDKLRLLYADDNITSRGYIEIPQSVLNKHQQDMLEIMQKLLLENEELQQAVQAHSILSQTLKARTSDE